MKYVARTVFIAPFQTLITITIQSVAILIPVVLRQCISCSIGSVFVRESINNWKKYLGLLLQFGRNINEGHEWLKKSRGISGNVCSIIQGVDAVAVF